MRLLQRIREGYKGGDEPRSRPPLVFAFLYLSLSFSFIALSGLLLHLLRVYPHFISFLVVLISFLSSPVCVHLRRCASDITKPSDVFPLPSINRNRPGMH